MEIQQFRQDEVTSRQMVNYMQSKPAAEPYGKWDCW